MSHVNKPSMACIHPVFVLSELQHTRFLFLGSILISVVINNSQTKRSTLIKKSYLWCECSVNCKQFCLARFISTIDSDETLKEVSITSSQRSLNCAKYPRVNELSVIYRNTNIHYYNTPAPTSVPAMAMHQLIEPREEKRKREIETDRERGRERERTFARRTGSPARR